MPKDPLRAFRIPDDEWHAALAAAKARGQSLSEVIRSALRRYVQNSKRK